jgi:AraC family transcriptional regulator, regulatory protein of adaptative response / DNA-3-methyladenine glycosylase II
VSLDHGALYRAFRARDARFDGRVFVGVRTTGVYCRPICPARTPRRENVTFFPSAAAAQEAGFRPCLRCRPETAPELAAWRGTSNTVARALPLIELGALDEAGVDALASRLGVGERQLRRLFRQHLGASPVAVAQTRRVLLAKQLLHETSLPMADVAMASGFGSIRRFNETFQHLFGRAPGALRRGRAAGPRGLTGGTVAIRLAYRPPYDWDAMLAFLEARALPGIERVADGVYRRTIEVGGRHGVIAVTPEAQEAVRVVVQLPELTALPAIVARVRRLFDLAADPRAIAAHLSEDATLAPLVRARPGLRVPGAWDGFELAVRAVLGQQVSVAAAVGLAGRLVAAYGRPLAGVETDVPGLTHVFPRPDRLAGVDFAALAMPRQRKAALAALATAAVARPRLCDAARDLDDAVAAWRELPGIGDWTAQYIAMRALGEPDAFPAGDAGLVRAMSERLGRRLAPGELLARAEAWRPWRAYAVLHLWTSLGTS